MLIDALRSARAYLACFDYDHYPACFAAFERSCAPDFAALTEENAAAEAEAIIASLSADWEALPRRERKDAAFRDKQVLALFLSPAAARSGGQAEAFSRLLRERWTARFPRNGYLPGDYETILKGFDANLLGLPLRKSKQRR